MFRSRLLDSLKWRAVGWMEIELSQADAAKYLNVSRSVIHQLWDQYLFEGSMSRRRSRLTSSHLQKTVFKYFRPEREESLLCR